MWESKRRRKVENWNEIKTNAQHRLSFKIVLRIDSLHGQTAKHHNHNTHTASCTIDMAWQHDNTSLCECIYTSFHMVLTLIAIATRLRTKYEESRNKQSCQFIPWDILCVCVKWQCVSSAYKCSISRYREGTNQITTHDDCVNTWKICQTEWNGEIDNRESWMEWR